jgi:hypothetical protein
LKVYYAARADDASSTVEQASAGDVR